jgi:hypothetical protein
MTMGVGELAQVLWAETQSLGIGRRDGTGDTNNVRRAVAQLAASMGGMGFDKRASLPALDDTRYGDTVQAIATIADQARAAAAPQNRLIVWRAGPDTSRLATDPRPPEPWASIDPASIVNLLRYELPSGDSIDIFSRPASPGGNDGAPLVNALTGTGVPNGKPLFATVTAQTTSNRYTTISWWIGIAGVLLFIAGGAMSALAGISMSGARNSLTATDPAYERLLLLKMGSVCVRDYQNLPSAPRADLCVKLLGENKIVNLPVEANKINWQNGDAALMAARSCAQDGTQPGCATAWRAAVEADQDQTWKSSFFRWMYVISTYVTGASSDAGSTSILVPFVTTLVGVVGLIVALGLGTVGRAAGVWIDTRNRVSLARAQVTLWTVVALGGYLVLAMFNIGFAAFLQSPEGLGVYHAFPSIPGSIAAALGIATGSTMASALILPTKMGADLTIQGADQNLANRGAPFFGNRSSGLDTRDAPALASLADIFMGEENANANTVDVSRLQNVMITITLVFGFFSLLAEMMSNISMSTMLTAHGPIFSALPDPGASFTWLLAISHATYLLAKAHDPQGTQSSASQGRPSG